LEKKTIEFFPPPLIEYGDNTAPSMSRNRSKMQGSAEKEQSWKPIGHLVASFNHHKGPVNVIKVSSDQTFFVSGSDDGNTIL
jgi:phosphoinositide-3-kinase regulatory subunit 4